MRPIYSQSRPAAAILTLAEIKAAVGAFDRGDANVFDTLGVIVMAVEEYQTAANAKPKRCQRRRRAA
jgi:hypothetical protein